MMSRPFPIIRRAPKESRVPVVVSVPHFGIEPLPGIGAEHYRESGYDTFPRGYTDAFASDVYGDLHHAGASLVATPYSRLFVDVNRAVTTSSTRRGGRVRERCHPHPRPRRPADLAQPLDPGEIEQRLRRFYDPVPHGARHARRRGGGPLRHRGGGGCAHREPAPHRRSRSGHRLAARRNGRSRPRGRGRGAFSGTWSSCRARCPRLCRRLHHAAIRAQIPRRLACDPGRDQRRHPHVDDDRGAS